MLDKIKTFRGKGSILVQATEDVTKFNECLAPVYFALFHDAITDGDIHESSLAFPTLPGQHLTVAKIFQHTFYLLAKKKT